MSRLPSAHRTLILRLKPSTVSALVMVAARENREVEVLLEDLVERTYTPDGLTKDERSQMSSAERIAALSQPISDPTTEAEIARLTDLAREAR